MTRDEVEKLAEEGKMSKSELAGLLRPVKRQLFLDVCTSLERVFTKRCGSCDPCLAGGCAMSEGEICLNACLNEDQNYYRAVTCVWAGLAD